MFIRKKKNTSGTISVQIIDKSTGTYRVVRTIGSSDHPNEIERLVAKAKAVIHPDESLQPPLFSTILPEDSAVENFLDSVASMHIRTIGPELIFGALFERMGFNIVQEELFRHLVVARLAYPASKLKTVDYLYRYQGIRTHEDQIYRFLDTLNEKHKEEVERIAYEQTSKTLGVISVVFYDMTTLYFDAEDEDDLRKIGFSKDGKFQNPQIMVGLLVGAGGYPIGYDIFEGNTFEGKTLLPVLEKIEKRYQLGKPIVLGKAQITNRGYNKFLTLSGEVMVAVDEEKVKDDSRWDGLKGYVTSTTLTSAEVIEHYGHLWQIEKAFRISKTDLRIRPIFHYKRRRIEAHICIVFVAYAIWKELERLLSEQNVTMSPQRAAELTHTMYQLEYTLPQSKQLKRRVLAMDDEQKLLYALIHKA